MLVRNNKRSKINNFFWYCSGFSIRELSSAFNTRSNYFAIGGINIFSTIFIFIISIWSFNIAFPKTHITIGLLTSLLISFLTFIFNRQTISALSFTDNSLNKRKHSLTFVPILLFSIFIGFIISTPVKFELFEIQISSNLFERIGRLSSLTDINMSANITSLSVTLLVILISALPTFIQYYALRSNFQKNRSSMLNELMWFCSGANKEILRKCPNDYSKYFGIGGTILFTALMATISGGYAFYTAFDDTNLALGFGLFWGAMIFNLDRFIVNTMYSDHEHSISKLELLSGAPRIIIAIFLGIVISYPLELKLFEDEINSRIEKLKVDNLRVYTGNLDSAFSTIGINNKEIQEIDTKITKLKNEISAAEQKYQSIKKTVKKTKQTTDLEGNPIEVVYYVYPPERAIYEQDYQQIKKENQDLITDARERQKDILNDIKGKEKQKAVYEGSNNKENVDLKDLSIRMEAFSLLKEEKPTVANASLFIMILLIIIEISPVLFKMMLSSGDYEVRLEASKNDIHIEELVRISKKNDWANAEISKIIEENKAAIASNVELLNAIAKAQSEIAQVAIEKWKEQEIIKARENPANIINSKNTNDQT